MKLRLLLFLWVLPHLLLAQTGTLFHGRITTAVPGETELLFINKKQQEGARYPLILREDGSFSISFPLDEAAYALFKHGNEQLKIYIEPGDSLWMELDTRQFDESVRFTGKGAGNNNFLAGFFLHFEDMNNGKFPSYISIQQYAQKNDPLEYKSIARDLEETELEYLKEHTEQLSSDFLNRRTLEIKYRWKGHLLDFPSWRGYMTSKKEKPFKVESLDVHYYDFIDTVQLMDSQAEGLPDYHSYIANVIENLCRLAATHNLDSEEKFFSQMKIAAKHLKGYSLEKFKLDLLADNLYELSFIKLLPYFQELSTSSIEEVREEAREMQALATRLSPGQTTNFKLTDASGVTVELSSYKGKILYIDFWASWCTPCIKEFPNSKQLQEIYKDREELVFIYISLDDEKEMWEKALEKHQLKGEQYWIAGFKQDVPQYFGINSIPRYILIDKEGKIIRSKAPRPGTEMIRALIDEALKK